MFNNMAIDYKLSKLIIRGFRGIDELELEFHDGYPSVLIGTNNAGKSTILNAIALALNGGGYHQWSPSETDFHSTVDGTRAVEFLVQIHFSSENEYGYPAVKGVAKPSLIHGIQVKGKMSKDGRASHSRTLFDAGGKTVTIEPRTSLSAQDKSAFADHDIGYKKLNARLDDIRKDTPEVWLFKPQNIEASLYLWKTGPIAKLSGLLAKRFLGDKWDVSRDNGKTSPMPDTMQTAYKFFQHALEEFPLWKDDMKPHLEEVIGRYVGAHAKVELRPDAQLFEEWISQQLMVSLATDPDSVATPLRNMGDGWQSVVRLAALEALSKYPELTKERVVLLLEEPETHLHPHLRRKLRKVLASLSAKGWTIVYIGLCRHR
jgi:energy-coupling factor transporter ATP-binding protein EcfA2